MTKKPVGIRALRFVANLIPGNYLKTLIYLNLISKPRKILRLMLTAFYRIDHIYDVLAEAKQKYRGDFTILEFGTNEGYAFRKMLYAVQFCGLTERVTVHGFDTFEGMPEPEDDKDLNMVTGKDEWGPGQFRGGYEKLKGYCDQHYRNFKLHQGLFNETLTDEFLETLKSSPPILVWIDSDFYSSARDALDRLIPYLPTGCVIYFDEPNFNFHSRLTGEMRIIYEINQGKFGDDIELVLDRELSWDSLSIYRFVRLGNGPRYNSINELTNHLGLSPHNDSPLP